MHGPGGVAAPTEPTTTKQGQGGAGVLKTKKRKQMSQAERTNMAFGLI